MSQAVKILFRRCFLLVFFSVFFASTASADIVKKYIRQYKPLIDSLSVEYGIPASVITAIAIVESGAGQSKNCKLLNNHFGIIGRNTAVKRKGIKTKFKEYLNAQASFRDFCGMISRKKFFRSLNGNTDYKLWVNAMAKAGYSTQPEVWKKMILNAIKHYKLDVANN